MGSFANPTARYYLTISEVSPSVADPDRHYPTYICRVRLTTYKTREYSGILLVFQIVNGKALRLVLPCLRNPQLPSSAVGKLSSLLDLLLFVQWAPQAAGNP